mgnify:CR=1 FL=1
MKKSKTSPRDLPDLSRSASIIASVSGRTLAEIQTRLAPASFRGLPRLTLPFFNFYLAR